MVEKPDKMRPFGRLTENQTIILKIPKKTYDETVWTGFIWLGTGTLVITIQARKGKSQ